MAKRLIEKGGLSEDGTRPLILHTQDADNRWREDVIERIPDAEADARIQVLIDNGLVSGVWP
jgi:hypothetical protein